MFKFQTRSRLMVMIALIFAVESVVQPVMALPSVPGPDQLYKESLEAIGESMKPNSDLRRAMALSRVAQMKTGFGGIDPALQEIMNAPMPAIETLLPNFTGVPTDVDPFFMRSERWENAEAQVRDYATLARKDSVEIYVPGSAKKLVVNYPLRQLIATDEYLFFQLAADSNQYDRWAGMAGSVGGGFFAVEISQLNMHAKRGSPVPFFFLPIEGKNWRSNLQALDIVEGDFLTLTNGIDPAFSIPMKEIRDLIQVSKANLDYSVLVALTNSNNFRAGSNTRVLPAPGSTAGLGLFFTGLDSSRPGWNFFKDVKYTDLNSSKFKDVVQMNLKQKLFAGFIEKSGKSLPFASLLMTSTPAMAAGDPVADALFRIMIFSGAIGATMVASFIALKTNESLVKKIISVEDKIKSLGKQVPETFQTFRRWLRVQGSLQTSIAQFPLISPSITLQYHFDKLMAGVASGEHTLIRKILNLTVLPNLRHFGKLSVNGRVTVMGAGWAATFGVAVAWAHYFYAMPLFVEHVAPHVFSDGISLALKEFFIDGDPAARAFLWIQLMVGATIGVLRGPADFTMDANSQVIDGIHSKVDEELRREGKNPHDPKIQSLREARIAEYSDKFLVQKGLPPMFERIFDSMSLYQKIASKRGYGQLGGDKPETYQFLADNVNPKSNYKVTKDAEGNPDMSGESFILASRRGMLPTFLRRALTQAEEWNKMDPSPASAKALELVKSMIRDSDRHKKKIQAVANYLYEASEKAQNGMELWDQVLDKEKRAKLRQDLAEIDLMTKSYRQLLIMSQYEGPIEFNTRFLPKIWSEKYGPAESEIAVLLFRRAAASVLDKSKGENYAPRRQDIIAYRDVAVTEALDEVRKSYPELAGKTDQEILSNPDLKTEVNHRATIIIKDKGDAQVAQENAGRFEYKQSWLERRRSRIVFARAEERFRDYVSEHPEMSDADGERIFKDFYAKEATRQIGLHIQGLAPESAKDYRNAQGVSFQPNNGKYETMLKEVRETAELLAKQELDTLNVKTFMAKLSPEAQKQLKLQIYANNFAQVYTDATTLTDSSVSSVDTAQPGMTQKYRQALARGMSAAFAGLDSFEASLNGNLNASARVREILDKPDRMTPEELAIAQADIAAQRAKGRTGTLTPSDEVRAILVKRGRLTAEEFAEVSATIHGQRLARKALGRVVGFQRKAISVVGSAANRGLRFIDSGFNDLHVGRGLTGILNRRLPFAEDFISANMRNMRFWPIGFTFSWAWSCYALYTGIPHSVWVAGFLFQGILQMAPVMWLFRNYRMQGFKPYDSDKGNLHLFAKYGLSEFLGYTVTFFGVLSSVLLSSRVEEITTRMITPVAGFFQSISPQEMGMLALSGALAWIGGKYYGKWKQRMEMRRLQLITEVTNRRAGILSTSKEKHSDSTQIKMCRQVFQ